MDKNSRVPTVSRIVVGKKVGLQEKYLFRNMDCRHDRSINGNSRHHGYVDQFYVHIKQRKKK